MRMVAKIGLGVALAATTLGAAIPAEAQRYRRPYRHGRGGDVATGAILGGIVGLGVGAAIASNNRGRFHDRGFRGYGPGFRGYGPGFGGFGPGYGAFGGGFYDGGFYAPPPRRFYRGFARPCVVRYRFDPYFGDVVPVTICR